MAHLVIRNKLTSKEYTISESDWEKLKEAKQAKKFTIIERIEPKKINVPKEVIKAVESRKDQTKTKDSND